MQQATPTRPSPLALAPTLHVSSVHQRAHQLRAARLRVPTTRQLICVTC